MIDLLSGFFSEPAYLRTEVAFHNQVWWYFEVINLVPSTIFLLYQIFTRLSFKNVTYDDEYLIEDYALEIRKKELNEKIIRVKGSWIDTYWRFYILSAMVYYVADSYYLM